MQVVNIVLFLKFSPWTLSGLGAALWGTPPPKVKFKFLGLTFKIPPHSVPHSPLHIVSH